jgi:hypothetical protein
MKTAILVILLSLISLPVYSQVTQEWAARYNSPSNRNDGTVDIEVDNSGNVYVLGSTDSPTIFVGDFVLIKYNSSGIQQWVQVYSGPDSSYESPADMTLDGQGNIYVTGQSGEPGITSLVLLKYNTSGIFQWARQYRPQRQAGGVSLQTDNSGNIFVLGITDTSSLGQGYDYVTLKYSASGDTLWTRFYDGPSRKSDVPMELSLDNSSNVYITGYSYNGTADSTSDYATLKYDSGGNLAWVRRYNGTGNNKDMAMAVTTDNSGNCYVTGMSRSGSTLGTEDYVTIKYLPNGDSSWVKRYNGTGNGYEEPADIKTDNSGNVFITGTTSKTGLFGYVYGTVKYSPSGMQEWVQQYAGPSNYGKASALAVDNSGCAYVTGQSIGTGTGFEFATIKYNPSGSQVWVKAYNNIAMAGDGASSIFVDASGFVYVTGYSEGISNNVNTSDFATIKYSQSTGITPLSTEIPGKYSLSQNYPNPFNPATDLEFRIADFGFVSLIIYDISGREIAVLVNEHLKAGTYKYTWDASHLNSGIYFYRLTAGNFSETKKAILIK